MIFQFHKGTIKTSVIIFIYKIVSSYFNSIKVQLKHYEFNHVPFSQKNFNSIKVQLKLSGGDTGMWHLTIFQFHKGTIKTHYFWIYNILIFNRISECKVKKSY